jgi:hypothetical protein
MYLERGWENGDFIPFYCVSVRCMLLGSCDQRIPMGLDFPHRSRPAVVPI